MRNLLLAVFTLAYSLSAAAQNKHPFTFEDMMALKRVEEPVPSPDGKWVLFAAVDVDLKANTKTPHVWVVPLSSGIHVSQNQGNVRHPSGEREIISDQDADRPRWAPDGKRFAFVSTKENGSQIWIADFDGATGAVTAKHRLTNIATEADGELWSPDGKNILFKSDVYPECDGAAAEESACNAKKLDDAKNSKVKAQIFTHLLYRHWNAYTEGKRTHLFVVPADGCATSHVGADASSARPSDGGQDVELRSTGRVVAPAPTHAGEGSGPCVAARDLTPGDYDAPVFSLGGQNNYAFSPDGQEICYASNHDPVPAISTNNDLFTVPVNVGTDASSAQVLAATKNITADNKAADETPLYSLDGRYIAYRAQQRPGYESDRFRLMLYDRKTGKSEVLVGASSPRGLDLWVGSYVWENGSNYRICFTAEHEGRSSIYAVAFSPGVGGGVFSSSGAEGYSDDLTVTNDGKTLLFTQMSLQHPVEISVVGSCKVCAGVGGDAPTSNTQLSASPACRELPCPIEQLTHLNDALLSQVSMSPLESFWFAGANNDKVQGFLVKPPNFDPSKRYPVKFLIHGGPQGAWGDDWSYRWNPELFAANGYVVIMINFHGSTGYGQKFIDAINGDWGGAPFEDLMKGLDYAEQHYPFIDKDRECALGASYGGYMTNWILGHTNRFKCIVSHDGTFNNESDWGTTEELWFNEWEFRGTPYTNRELYRKWSPHLFATSFKTPTLVIHGQLDYRLDVSEGFQLFTTLQRLGVPSKMLYFPDEGHWVLKPQNSQLWYKTVNDWVDQWVGK
jgi:dipeptidyl aminopeptidase/acylaminoacyl peptidase